MDHKKEMIIETQNDENNSIEKTKLIEWKINEETQNLNEIEYWFIVDNIINYNIWYSEALLKNSISSEISWYLIPHLQKIINNKDSTVKKYEVLFRYHSKWQDRLHYPNMLDDISNETSDWILIKMIDLVIKEIETKELDELQNYSISFNFRESNIISKDILNYLFSLKNNSILKPSQIIIEVLEDVPNTEEVLQSLKQFKNLWYEIAIDDFWINESTINKVSTYVEAWVIDTVKIDRLYYQEHKNSTWMRLLLKFIHSLNLEIVIEWIETKEDQESVEKEWVTFSQWYFHWKPINYKEVF